MPHHLRELTDRQAVADLINRLGLWLDEKRFAETGPVFAEDVTVDTPGGSARGTELVAAQARRNHDGYETQHVITNVLIDLDGDRATARANLVATFAGGGGEPAFTVGERYAFEAVRTPDGWRLSRVQVTPVWMSGSRA